MPIFNTDTDKDKYTGPESISTTHKECLDEILEHSLTHNERVTLACRRQGDTYSQIAIRLMISKKKAERTYKRACLKVSKLVKAIKSL